MGNESIEGRLTNFLQNGKDWEREQTNIPGIFLIRLPPSAADPLALESSSTY